MIRAQYAVTRTVPTLPTAPRGVLSPAMSTSVRFFVAGDEDLLIEVKASATNPVDLKACKSNTTADRILGFDGAGIVRALGAKVGRRDALQGRR
jgi:NADPH:quinone reductase-like Zn-dependent oxidoreductase